MEKLKTFLEMRLNEDVYNDIVPESLQETINAWFDSRKVCDNDNFKRFFQRVLRRDYHRYNELLRIEAGAKYNTRAGYDWLVNSYLEREVISGGIRTNENGQTVTITPQVVTSTQEVLSLNYGSKSTLTHGLKSETTYGRKDDTNVESLSDEGTGQSSNASAVAKDLPASTIGTYSPSNKSDASFDGVDVETTLGVNNSFNEELNMPTAINKSDANSISHSIRNGSSETVNQSSGKDSTQNSGQDETAKTGRDENTRNVTTSKSGQDVTMTSGDGSEEHHDKTHEIYTGRSGGAPAEMLIKAREYIETTSAWEWLRFQLEPCFFGIFDV